MEKQMIHFERVKLPIMIYDLRMQEGRFYRGMHSHRAIEIVQVKSGVLNCYVGDDIMVLYPGQIAFINSDVGHRLASANAEISYLYVDMSLLGENNVMEDEFSMLHAFVSRTQTKPCMVFSDHEEITELLSRINAKYHEDTWENYWYLKAYLYELVAFMHAQSFVAPLMISREQIAKIDAIVRFIDGNFRLPISLDDICAAAKYNKFSVCHGFKAATGSTIFEYINFLRASDAVEKLMGKEESIAEIATQCGFSSATYFNRVFKKFFGCAPSVYRKLSHGNMIHLRELR